MRNTPYIKQNPDRSLFAQGCGTNDDGQNRRLLRLFRALNLLTEDYSRVFAIVYGGAHLCMMCISLFSAYGAIRLEGALSISLGWIGANITVFLAILISQFGRINHSSQLALKAMRKRQEALRSMGNQAESKSLRMEIRSLRDLCIRVGSTFFYDKILLLTTSQIIIQNIANLLLLH